MEKNNRIDSLSVCLDMCGCPNRCRHCWLGHMPNGRLTEDDLRFVAESFRPFADRFEVDDWYREPDYHNRYRERWALTAELSTHKTPHFELMSVYRAVRDPGYIPWLREQGVRVCQLTLFGGEEITDRYTGRRGAYREILQTIELLLQNGIAPRIQTFLNRETAPELAKVEALVHELHLPERCRAIGQEFAFYTFSGGCDGANERNYPIWPTKAEVDMIPPFLKQQTLLHFGTQEIMDVFGRTEAEWLRGFARSDEVLDFAARERGNLVLYVDAEFNVYPNLSAPEPHWLLGNLRTDGAETVLENFLLNRSPAQHVRLTVPLREIARACGDPSSQVLFTRGDYVIFLLNRYCRRICEKG